ncbi:hypothetical protein AUF62_02410 [archaeon 13_1_20CM_52_20]|nr:MAG: hypothetical protein AUF62_02410 [archaeon 13_1_20CM_52_20]
MSLNRCPAWDHTLDYANALATEVEHAGGISTSILMGNDFYWAYLKGSQRNNTPVDRTASSPSLTRQTQ